MSAAEIDWQAAEAVADRLGVHTRELVKRRDPDAVREWAVRASHDFGSYSAGNAQRAASYHELAVLMDPPTDES